MTLLDNFLTANKAFSGKIYPSASTWFASL